MSLKSFFVPVWLYISVFLLLVVIGCVHPALTPPAITGDLAEDDVLSAVAQIDVSTTDGRHPAMVALKVQKPSYLRLELLPVIGTPALLLAASPEKMSILIPAQGKYYYGRPTAANLGKFLPWQFAVEDMVMILFGAYPSLRENDVVYQTYKEGNLLRMEMKAPSGTSQIVWMENDKKIRTLVRRDPSGKAMYKVEYIYPEAGGLIPEKINVGMADGKTSLSVKYSDVTIEKSGDLTVFNIPCPDGIAAIPLE